MLPAGGLRDESQTELLMPDHLAKPGACAGTPSDQADAELELERGWLASSLRCFLDDGRESNAPKREALYRLPTSWWLVLVDCFLRARTTQGLEAFSSPQTAGAAAKLCRMQKRCRIEPFFLRSAETRGGHFSGWGCLWTNVP